MEIIILFALLAGGYFAYTRMKGNGDGQGLEKTEKEESSSELFNMKKGWLVDFFDNFILKGFPIEGHNMLEFGPYEVVGINRTTSTTEYTIRGKKGDAVLEVEQKGGRNIILIQTGLDNFPSMLPQLKKAWSRDKEELEFKGVRYYLVGKGEEVDGGEECYYWDYYSDPINEDNKLFLGVQDYGDPGKEELEFFVGFEIPERSVKDILPAA